MTQTSVSKRYRYVVERFGYNDGLPYEVSTHGGAFSGENGLLHAVKDAPKCRHRLIIVVKEEDASDVSDPDRWNVGV